MLLFLSDHIIIEVIKENKKRKKYIGIQHIPSIKYNIDLVMYRTTVFIILPWHPKCYYLQSFHPSQNLFIKTFSNHTFGK